MQSDLIDRVDLFVYGATPAGIVCAVRAARLGLRVILATREQHVGGFITSGAGGWESPYDGNRAPLLTEVQARISEYYRLTYGEGSPQHLASLPSKNSRRHIDRRKCEPRVAEQVFEAMLGEQPMIRLLRRHVLSSVTRRHEQIESVDVTDLVEQAICTVRATVYVDATYEGDLAASARVAYRIGRESRDEYNEPHAGRLFIRKVAGNGEPSQHPQDAVEGRLNMRTFGHYAEEILEGPSTGEGDGCVMAYNVRLVLTNEAANRIPIQRPAHYDPELARSMAWGSIVSGLPNGKIAWNCGRLIGPQHAYPEADWATRDQIHAQYQSAILSQLWFIQNDPSADPRAKARLAEMGLPRDEFADNGHLPYELYVREGRRIVGQYVLTEHDIALQPGKRRTKVNADSIAITDWPMDSVACTTLHAEGGGCDGQFFLSGLSRPAQVPYRCILPKDCDNLLVPVAVSASHVAYGAIRLEPVWMQLAEAAGYAAEMAVCSGISPNRIDIEQLQRKFISDGAMISFFNDVPIEAPQAWTTAIQFLGTRGFFDTYDARPAETLGESAAREWTTRWREMSKSAGTLDVAETRAAAVLRIDADLQRNRK